MPMQRVSKGDPCTCGKRLPWHLIPLGVTHVCTCGLEWSEDGDGACCRVSEAAETALAKAVAARAR